MNAGRPKEFDTDKALESAMHQFWRVGYEATSLQDLLKAMRLSKSSLYQTFGSKHELFLRSIDIYQHTSADELHKKLNDSRNSKIFLKGFLDSVIAESTSRNKKGCLLVNTINELGYRDKAVSKAVAIGLNNMAGVIRSAIESGKKEGAIDAIKNTDMLVNYFITNVCGLRTLVKSGADKSELLSVVNMIIKTVY